MASESPLPDTLPARLASGLVRFGAFELDLDAGELRKAGALVKLRQQPFKALALLLSEPGRIFTREELRQALWGSETFVDFDQGLNYCIKEIRATLGDNADAPMYIETLPRRGYRWIFPLEQLERSGARLGPALPPESEPQPAVAGWRGRWRWLQHAFTLAALAGCAFLVLRPAAAPPEWQRLTFRRGSISAARFAPGGDVVYSAAWDGERDELYQVKIGPPDARPLGLGPATLAGVSRDGDVAYVQVQADGARLLSRVPLAGGASRSVLEHVFSADFARDGQLAVLHSVVGKGLRVEYPIGRVLGSASIGALRVSPDGAHVAISQHPTNGEDSGYVQVFGRDGKSPALGGFWASLEGLAWSPRGDEIWFTAARAGQETALWAVSLEGRLRRLLPASGRLVLRDVARDGRALVERTSARIETSVVDAAGSHDLSWFDATRLVDLSADGKTALLAETGEGGGPEHAIYLRSVAGAPPVRLGRGHPGGLSSDGRFVTSVPVADPDHVDILPTGAGQPRRFQAERVGHYQSARFLPDGQRMLLVAAELGHNMRVWICGPDGRKPLPLTPDGITGMLLSPDAREIISGCPPRSSCVYPLDGGAPRAIPGLEDWVPQFWDAAGQGIYVGKRSGALLRIEHLELASGKRTPWKTVGPADPIGVSALGRVIATPDARVYGFSYLRRLSDLYVVTGLR